MAGRITDDLTVSTTELAKVLGLTGRRVQQLIQDGILLPVEKGQLNLYDCVQAYLKFISKGEMTEEDVKLDKSKRTSETILKASKAKIAKLEADELEGRMHRAEDVAAMTSDLIYTIRSALLALPGRLAIDTAAAQTPSEAVIIIRKEVHKIMGELAAFRYDPAKYEERVRARMDWSGVDDDE